ncbi:hypothetical protein [Lactococcus lactis]|jgi:hypothetical protein|uniref:hypothetical protein n=1 Tax=Lactococcus lactis TaxID=1358 RepID=UPI00288FF197|nr:hypothetical protein [Lactococcus lactis]MDT2909312.1 hypothetical protein [Lactococcus lactis]MDT2925158.1 hypothetical protein [Lactococcus lactis]MDT2952017.1 hypothetical protein [Lactococcus lactis]
MKTEEKSPVEFIGADDFVRNFLWKWKRYCKMYNLDSEETRNFEETFENYLIFRSTENMTYLLKKLSEEPGERIYRVLKKGSSALMNQQQQLFAVVHEL